MPSIDWTKPAIKVDNIGEYVINSRERANYTFRILPTGENVFVKKREVLTAEQLDEKFPVNLNPILPKGGNIDRTKNWIHGKKSY